MGVRMRLGIHPLPAFNPHTCPLCLKDMSDNPYHALGCGKLKQTVVHARHDKACALIAEFARSCDAVATCTTRSDGSKGDTVPDGYIYLRNKSISFDVTGINTHFKSYETREARTNGGALKDREGAKIKTYRQHAADNDLEFIPVVIDLYGRCGDKAIKLFEDIALELTSIDSYRAPHINMSLTDFMIELSCIWQKFKFNARIISQWACKSRQVIYKRNNRR